MTVTVYTAKHENVYECAKSVQENGNILCVTGKKGSKYMYNWEHVIYYSVKYDVGEQ